MTILPSSLGPAAPTPPVESAADASVGTDAQAPATPPSGAAPAVPGDRLDLSAAARTTSAPPATVDASLETAQIALRSGGEMSDARLFELREQVRSGHYDQPEVIGRIAEAAAQDLTGTASTD